MKVKTKRKDVLSDKIADALTVKPRADIEEDHVFGTKPKTVSHVDYNSSESEDDTEISDFRKKNLCLLSEINKKYEGEVVSRKELMSKESDAESVGSSDKGNGVDKDLDSRSDNEEELVSSKESDGSDSSEDNLDYSIIQKGQTESEESNKSGSELDDEEDDDEEDDDEEEEGYDISQLEAPVLENFEHMKKQNVSEEVKKGTSVRNQLLLWENLLELRIHMQRCINTCNQLPMFDVFETMKNAENDEFVAETNLANSNMTNVLDKLLKMQQLLFQGFPDTKAIFSTNKKELSKNEITTDKKGESDEEIPSDTEDEEIPSDTEDEGPNGDTINQKMKQNTIQTTQKKRKLGDYEQEISKTHKAFKGFRDSTIKKWNEKTRIGSAANIKNTPTNTILQQISFILSDRNKLIKRTQLKRSEYDIVGYEKPSTSNNINNNEEKDIISNIGKDRKDNDEYIPEIFDDSDFYHQLLRELIECKSSDISDPVQLSRQWIALQQMRSKMKRKVDTKATKGRRIKYVVHNPLVNFMGPERNLSWTDDSKNELYSSLFGKMFEHNNEMDMDNNFLFSNK